MFKPIELNHRVSETPLVEGSSAQRAADTLDALLDKALVELKKVPRQIDNRTMPPRTLVARAPEQGVWIYERHDGRREIEFRFEVRFYELLGSFRGQQKPPFFELGFFEELNADKTTLQRALDALSQREVFKQNWTVHEPKTEVRDAESTPTHCYTIRITPRD
jgi:hypothetical protein